MVGAVDSEWQIVGLRQRNHFEATVLRAVCTRAGVGGALLRHRGPYELLCPLLRPLLPGPALEYF